MGISGLDRIEAANLSLELAIEDADFSRLCSAIEGGAEINLVKIEDGIKMTALSRVIKLSIIARQIADGPDEDFEKLFSYLLGKGANPTLPIGLESPLYLACEAGLYKLCAQMFGAAKYHNIKLDQATTDLFWKLIYEREAELASLKEIATKFGF